MAGLRFKIVELQRETTSLLTMGEKFLDSQTWWALERFSSNLQSIGDVRDGRACTLELERLRTSPSTDYESGSRHGGIEIYAVISGTWDLLPLQNREIEFCGNASTRIEVYASNDSTKRLAMWRLEVGSEDSPGCYIHAQILGDLYEPPFPKSVPIPRLPSIFITPMSAIEFVLGELFQDKWAKVTAENTDAAQYWRALQQKRLQRLFSWYQSTLQNSRSSPWMTLKAAKPDGQLLLAD